MWSTRHSTGCPGTTSTAFSNRSDTFLQSSSSRCTIATKQLQSPWPESTKTVSGKPGAVHSDNYRRACVGDVGKPSALGEAFPSAVGILVFRISTALHLPQASVSFFLVLFLSFGKKLRFQDPQDRRPRGDPTLRTWFLSRVSPFQLDAVVSVVSPTCAETGRIRFRSR